MWRPARPAIWPSSAGVEIAMHLAVEFAHAGEGDVIDDPY